jgi:phosphatidylglycerol:prolipoprotein diacylglycerol transferase
MRQTLFYIPHELVGFPVFGLFSWGSVLLLLFVVVQLAIANSAARRTQLLQTNGLVWAGVLFVLAFVLPRIETRIGDWTIGLPVRGYGVLMMLGVIFGAAVGLKRSESRGISKDAFFSLATWGVVSGIVGARLFYVIQHWDTLDGETLSDRLYSSLQFTEGGLVVYGGVIAGLIAISYWAYSFKVSLLKVADAVTPAFFLGLAFGRIGCLLNGCCYGGLCDSHLPSISFPSGSAVYSDQLLNGRLVGLVINDERIISVDKNSWADENNIQPGQTITQIEPRQVSGPTPDNPLAHPELDLLMKVDGKTMRAHPLPSRSLGVHPSQIYASFGGLLLFLWTASLSNLLKRQGLIFASGLMAYGVVRILEEYIRVDEAGQFGTELSISQWISIGAILGGVLIVVARLLRSGPVDAEATR